MIDEHGNLKYPKLYALVQAILSLNHGNAFPERGFLINKQLLQSHGHVMKEKFIVSLRLRKYELIRAGGVKLINSVKMHCQSNILQIGTAEVDCGEREKAKNALS